MTIRFHRQASQCKYKNMNKTRFRIFMTPFTLIGCFDFFIILFIRSTRMALKSWKNLKAGWIASIKVKPSSERESKTNLQLRVYS